jgi:hypothetical protein
VREENPSNLPAGYTLDLVGDPCVIVLMRADGTVVARFTRNVDPREVRRAAEEDSAAKGPSLAVSSGGPRSPSRYGRSGDTWRS